MENVFRHILGLLHQRSSRRCRTSELDLILDTLNELLPLSTSIGSFTPRLPFLFILLIALRTNVCAQFGLLQLALGAEERFALVSLE